jgi:aminoglycoside phosphotransferase (APT) family kinase protein
MDITMPLERASSVTNEVWLSESYVIRVNRHPNQRLRREAALAPSLPAEVGYPPIVAYGGELGADYLIAERVPGLVLARCWPAMSRDERRDAVRQLAAKLRCIHQTPTPTGLPEIETPQLIGGRGFSPIEPLIGTLEKLKGIEFVSEKLMSDTIALVKRNGGVLDSFDTSTLIHGDLTFENVLWDGSEITAILDFEWARGGPRDLDLDVFLRFCAFPFLHVAEDYQDLALPEDYTEVPWWVAEEYPELFDFPNQYERVRLYAIAFDARELLLYPPNARPAQLSPHHPHNRLDRVVHGHSYLDQLRGEADRTAL